MRQFEIHPELFEGRTLIAEALSSAGIIWFTDYQTIDVQHDVVGYEVYGIKDEATAIRVQDILQRLLPDMSHGHCYFDDANNPSMRWVVRISRFGDVPEENWT